MTIIRSIKGLTKFEWELWIVSVVTITISFFIGENMHLSILVASLIGVTALIFLAKGNPLGQFLIIVFSIIYGVISFQLKYYGEMITYIGMTAPMAVVTFIEWLRHPFEKGKSQVEVAKVTKGKILLTVILTIIVTIVFHFILNFFETADVIVSTVSITTSFVAVCLTFFRSSYYALGYALNDIVLIILWSFATVRDTSSLPMVVCFTMFLVNDLYGFYSWKKIENKQNKIRNKKQA